MNRSKEFCRSYARKVLDQVRDQQYENAYLAASISFFSEVNKETGRQQAIAEGVRCLLAAVYALMPERSLKDRTLIYFRVSTF